MNESPDQGFALVAPRVDIVATALIHFAELLKDVPAGVWVAISEEEQKVVAFGADIQQVIAEARDKGVKTPLIVKAPDRQQIVFL
jgi:Family of unknown function (DUF5678)